jgi:hypothetical protein
MKNWIKSLLGTCCIATTGLLSADVASASEDEAAALAISACRPVSGTPTYGWSGIFNASTTTALALDCSIPTTLVPRGAFQGAWTSYAAVYAYDATTTGSVSCSIKVIWDDGTTQYSATRNTGVSSVTGSYPYDILDVSPEADGMAYFSCTIPPATGSGGATRSGILAMYAGNVVPD